MSLVHNERMKLLASAMSNTGVATIVTAIVAPTAGFFYGSAAPSGGWWPVLALAWFVGGMSLHITAQLLLGRLEE
jgi:hypothetical protein